MNEIIIKFANNNIHEELNNIGFDKSYLLNALDTYKGKSIKVTNLKPEEANILKQLCLSLGFDCAVNRETINCKCEYTDAIIFASNNGYKKLISKLEKQPFRLKELKNKLNEIFTDIEPLNIRTYKYDWTRPYIMGILNVTPDSFSDGGKYNDPDNALKHAIMMLNDGADFIDIGGESTRPGAEILSVDEEIKRVLPVIKLIRKENIDLPISVDTRNYETAKAAIEEGADIINDVSGFSYDKKLLDYVCRNNIPSVVMHSDSVPALNTDFTKEDIIESIYKSLYDKIILLESLGLKKSNIIADTGIGFGKSKENCFNILKRHEEFTSLRVAMLLGISRKSFIRNEFKINFEEADTLTALYSSLLSSKGVNIHRVHNVKLVKQYLDFTSAI